MRNLFVSSILLLGALPAALPAQTGTAGSEQTYLTPGDSIRIVVWRRPDFSGDFVITPEGSISHPLYRAVKVAGMPFATAETNLRTFLARFEENPQFVMEPLIRIAVLGEVLRPQTYSVRPQTSIAEAVARAGGIREEGAANRVRVTRTQPGGARQELQVDLDRSQTGMALSPVQSGDLIVVERRGNFVQGFLLPALGVIGSIASVGILIDRASNGR